MNWKSCKTAFHVDGSLRDIYVYEMTAIDWKKFLDFASTYKTTWSCDDGVIEMPGSVPDVFEIKAQRGLLLEIEQNGVTLNCHFFSEDELELDLDPKEISSQSELDFIVDVLFGIGVTLNKAVVLTDENDPTFQWFKYDPEISIVQFLH